jgi:hypothetical protein
MTLKKLIFVGALGALVTTGSAVAPAFADSIKYTLTDASGDLITFTLPQDPTPIATLFGFAESTTVTIDGASETEDVTFYDQGSAGGLSIAPTPEVDGILDQGGDQLYTGSTSAPTLLTETNIQLICTSLIPNMSPTGSCTEDKYSEWFTLNAVDIPSATPEPGSFALMLTGLGLLGLLMAKARA